MAIDISIRIGGKAGQGMQSISSIIGKIFSRHDYYVFINQDFESRIRGGHNFEQARVADTPVYTVNNRVNILVALDRETIRQDLPSLTTGGVMIYDGGETEFESDDPNHVSVPLSKLAVDAGKNKIMANTVATGAVFALLGFGIEPLLQKLEENFGIKGPAIVESNKNSASAGYRYIREHFNGSGALKIPETPMVRKKMLLNGSHAMALGAGCSGLKFYSGYPMSPSTGIMETVAGMAKEYGIVMEQAEDEISAVNMAIGASFAGVRAMTATSGGGFCLMVEALGLAGMTETPLVIVNAQRPGPSTGLPTRTEQSDLQFVLHASHGEFPRAVFAPGTPGQAFYLMNKAFNMADRYQVPVIVLGDQYLNDSFFTVDDLDMDRVTIDRGHIVSDRDIPSAKDYKRYTLTDSGISPRILPGQTQAVLYADSDEHTEAGHITERVDVRNQMMRKRMKKLDGMKKEMGAPEFYPDKESEVVILGWGSTYGAIKEAVDRLISEGTRCRMLHFSEIFPFPEKDFLKKISDKVKIFSVENNYTGQFADYFSVETGRSIHHKILKYDGRPFSSHEIVEQVQSRM
jgi:2-oxoglutarate/2-oxoacid ferredoxin oxidoreductase subunit alpha